MERSTPVQNFMLASKTERFRCFAALLPGFSLEPTRVAAYGKETASDKGLNTVGTCNGD